MSSLWIALAMLAGAAITGFGSSAAAGETNSSGGIQFAQCMRANGVPDFPDPDANGDIQFPITSPIPHSPAFQRAQNGPCKRYMTDR